MPTVLRAGQWRFYFYSNDRHEPRHVHVESGSATAKYWLDPVMLAGSCGLTRHTLVELEHIVIENAVLFREAWDDYFDR